jgi:hypothetical protein
MSDHIHQAELAALEAALKGLAPAPATLDRDQLFFRAGQASLPRRRWLTRVTIASLTLAVGILAALLVLQPQPQRVEHVVVVTVPVPTPMQPVDVPVAPPPESLPDPSTPAPLTPVFSTHYLRTRDQALRWGVESLPEPDPTPLADLPQRPTSMLDLLRGES